MATQKTFAETLVSCFLKNLLEANASARVEKA